MRIRPARFSADLDAVVGLNREYLTWATGRLLDEFQQVMPVPDDATAAEQLRAFDRPDAALLVIEHQNDLIGMGALRTLKPTVVEVKRVYVRPGHQRRGMGSALFDTLLDSAFHRLGALTVRLDTCRFMVQAQRLYERRDFVERDPYEGTEVPEPLRKYWRFYERREGRET
jgi:ribosomal protein S18 acetylase RimI-like enzyme